MNTTLNVDRVWPERVAGYANSFLAEGLLERVNGNMLRTEHMRATVILPDGKAEEIIDWLLANPGHAFPYSVSSNRQIVGMRLVREPARV